MGIIARQGAWNFIVIYVGVILGTVNNLFLMPHAMSKAQLGVLSVLLSLMIIGGQVALFGSQHTLMKFYPKYKGEESEHKFVSYVMRNLLISLLISVGIYLAFKEDIIEAYSNRSALFGKYYFMYIPLLTFYVYQEFFGGYLRSLLKTVHNSIVKEVILRVYQSALFALLIIDLLTFEIFLLFYVGGYLLTSLLNYWGVRKYGGFKLRFRFDTKRREKKKILKYSAAVFTTGIAGAMLSNIDIIMIGAIAPAIAGLDGMELAGIYGRMAFMAILILIPLRSVLNIAVPMVSKAWEKNDMDELQAIYSKSSLTLTILGMFTFIGIWVNIDSVFLILPEGFEIGKSAFLFLGIANLLHTGLGVNGSIISNSPYYWINGFGVPILAAMVIMTNIIFIPKYGIIGAAMATAGSRFVFSFVAYFFLLLKYRMQPFTWRNFYVIGIGLAIIFLIDLMPNQGSLILDVLIRSVVVLILFIPAIIVPKISAEINEMTGNVLKRIWPGKSF